MKVVIVNGSPRKGNSEAAIKALISGMDPSYEIEIINAAQLKISGCCGCGECFNKNGCVADDDTNPTIAKLVEADLIVLATPVFWWGITAQMKLVIDKFYSRATALKNKSAGFIVVGGSATDSIQYELIEKQLGLIAEYMNWNIIFNKKYFAYGPTDLADNDDVVTELKRIGSLIR